jgi:glycosyltransferase involved in cell wall biosynthesis
MSPASILAYAPGTWRWPSIPGSTRYYLWSLAERGWPVVYVEPPQKWAWKTSIWRAEDRPFTVATLPYVPPFGVRGIPFESSGEWLRWVTCTRMKSATHALCKSEKFTPQILWLGAPWQSRLIPTGTQKPLVVHHNYDELALSPFLKPFQQNLLHSWETELITQSDVVLCSSHAQAAKRRSLNSNTHVLENAVKDDFLQVSSEEPPMMPERTRVLVEEMRKLPRPLLVYGGVVDHRLNAAWFMAVQKAFTSGTLVFLGNLDATASIEMVKLLKESPNVWGGKRMAHDDYPWLYGEADVLLFAHEQTPFTEGMFPDKMGEYLASGKPIVSIRTAELERLAGESRKNVIRLAGTQEEFLAQIQHALKEQEPIYPALRRGLAAKRTWNTQTTRLERILERSLRVSDNSKAPESP